MIKYQKDDFDGSFEDIMDSINNILNNKNESLETNNKGEKKEDNNE